MKTIVILVLLVVAGFVAYVRLAPTDPAVWNIDPVAVEKPAKTNNFLIRPGDGDAAAPVYREQPEELAARIDAAMLAMPRTARIAGSPDEMQMTYLTRSKLMGFPDFTTIRVIWGSDGSSFAAYARSRFGQDDGGVNKARVAALLTALGG